MHVSYVHHMTDNSLQTHLLLGLLHPQLLPHTIARNYVVLIVHYAAR